MKSRCRIDVLLVASLVGATLIGLTAWYFVHRKHAAERGTAERLADSARMAASRVDACAAVSGAPALVCW